MLIISGFAELVEVGCIPEVTVIQLADVVLARSPQQLLTNGLLWAIEGVLIPKAVVNIFGP